MNKMFKISLDNRLYFVNGTMVAQAGVARVGDVGLKLALQGLET